MSSRRRCALILLALLGRSASALACDTERLDTGMPVQVPLGPAGFGTLPAACGAKSLAFKGAGSALVAEEDFYGYLEGSASLEARYTLPSGDWLSLETPSLDYWFSANATVEVDTVEMGPGALGYHAQLPVLHGVTVAPYAELLLPSDTIYHNARRYGLTHGVSAMTSLTPSLEVVGGLTFPVLVVHNSGSFHVTQVAQAAADASLRVFSFFSLAGGFGVRVRSGRVPGFESFDPRFALRFQPYRQLYAHVAVALPLFGDDRTDLVGALLVGWRFGK